MSSGTARPDIFLIPEIDPEGSIAHDMNSGEPTADGLKGWDVALPLEPPSHSEAKMFDSLFSKIQQESWESVAAVAYVLKQLYALSRNTPIPHPRMLLKFVPNAIRSC